MKIKLAALLTIVLFLGSAASFASEAPEPDTASVTPTPTPTPQKPTPTLQKPTDSHHL